MKKNELIELLLAHRAAHVTEVQRMRELKRFNKGELELLLEAATHPDAAVAQRIRLQVNETACARQAGRR